MPKLCNRNGDLKKRWYVEVSQRNPRDGEMYRKRFEKLDSCNINDLTDVESREKLGEEIIEKLRHKLNNGWTIFSDITETVHEDQLQYASTARFYKQQVNSNNNYTFWASIYIDETLSKQKASKDTIDTYKSRYRVFGNWLHSKSLSMHDISAITNTDVKAFFDFLKDDRKMCKHTYESYRYLLYTLFQFIIKKGGITDNPMYDIPENWRTGDNAAELIEESDLKKLITEIDKCDPQVGLACRFEYYCGMRPGYEIRLLKIEHIDFSRNRSKVTVTSENAKTGRLRKVVIPDVFLDYLINVWRLDKYDSNFYVLGRNGKPGTLPFGKNTLRDRFNKIKERLGLPKSYKFYSLKCTGAVNLARNGVSIIEIRNHLGHTKLETTEIYLKRHDNEESKKIRNIPDIFD
ncbi:MAG: tyrosine-type recombinase/integrase [Prevotellaceae bacterium]|jgi:site-specific recombinase XerD|nr:tyrosine-type recombinase/integrase [Prevotellaceae bacterium]